ncbi:hypothetical protein MHIMP23_01450 [Methylobacterium hispanicum]
MAAKSYEMAIDGGGMRLQVGGNIVRNLGVWLIGGPLCGRLPQLQDEIYVGFVLAVGDRNR